MRRTRFYDNQIVFVDGLTWMQDGFADHLKWRVSDFFSNGVLEGLTVMANYDGLTGTVRVFPGIAYDEEGERIYLPDEINSLMYNDRLINTEAGIYYITARYKDDYRLYCPVGIDLDGISHQTHITDSYSVQVLKSGVDAIPDNDVILGEVIINNPYDPVIVTASNREGVVLDPDISVYEGVTEGMVWSQHIREADGTTGQDTNSGSGVKSGHIANGAITYEKLNPRVFGPENIFPEAVTNLHLNTNCIHYLEVRDCVKFHKSRNNSADPFTAGNLASVTFTPTKPCTLLILASIWYHQNTDVGNYIYLTIQIDGVGKTVIAGEMPGSVSRASGTALVWVEERVNPVSHTVTLRGDNGGFGSTFDVRYANLIVMEIPQVERPN